MARNSKTNLFPSYVKKCIYSSIFVLVYFKCNVEARLKEALIYNIDTKKLDDLKHRSNASDWNCLTACPASSPQEHQLNANVSISGNSLFMREFHQDINHRQKIKTRICEQPIKSATIYDPKWNEYFVGYELYYDEKELTMKFDNYDRFESPNDGNDLMSPRQPHNSSIFRYQDGKSIRFYFADGFPTLIFHWINVLSIKCLPEHQKRINFGTVEYENVEKYPTDECEDFYPEYKKIKFIHPTSNSTINLEEFFVKWQIIPLWYFVTNSAKLASCSYANIIPVWKGAVDKQLKKVDVFVYAVTRYFKRIFSNVEVKLDFGVFGNQAVGLSGSEDPQEKLNVYMTESQHSRNISIPKIIFRIVKCKITTHNYWYVQSAAVIVHNDRIAASDSQRLCKEEEELRGWDHIKNNDHSEGLTYVCPVTKELNGKLGLMGIVSKDEIFHLNLDKVPSKRMQSSGAISYENTTDEIVNEFENLWWL